MTLSFDTNPLYPTGLDNLEATPISTDVGAVEALLQHCPAAAATPLHLLDDEARRLGLGGLYAKDERARMGMGSFKALGAAFVIAREAAAARGDRPWAEALEGRVFVTASAGNHGLSVVAGSRIFGASSVIYLSRTVPGSFAERLRGMGAEVVIAGDDYEASMVAAEDAAEANGWTLLSDSTWPGHDGGVGVMQGYLVAAREAADDCPQPPSHVFLQAGVGGFAAAMAVHLRARFGATPRIIVVEPDRAPALRQGMAERAICDAGSGVSSMGRLDCKRASQTALLSLSQTATDFATISDDDVAARLPQMAAAGLATSPSGGAGLAAAMMAAEQGLFGLGAESRVLVFISEGPVDD
ncbi:MAG: pyridoxal-phosphate dependent enzyme [Candidatus Puniceispirillales bacterium]